MDFSWNALGLSHHWISMAVKPGDFVIDATAGRGRDTLFLSQLVGKEGKVLAFDIQKEAVESTEALLKENDVANAQVLLACHSTMDQWATEESVSAVMFNFGWLPGGNHNLHSHAETSVKAVNQALKLLKVGGIATLCIYYGKETGYEEKEALLRHTEKLDPKRFSVLYQSFINRTGESPLCILIRKDNSLR